MLQFEYDYLMEVAEIISINVRAARARAKITQKTVALRCGVTEQTIRDIEAGRRKPSVDLLFSLGVALGVSSSSFLDTEAEPAPIYLAPSKALKKYLSVPDKVIELASQLDPGSDDVWEDIIETLNIALAQKEIHEG